MNTVQKLANKSGLVTYVAQRVTAIMLLPLCVWLVVFVVKLSGSHSVNEMGQLLLDPFNVITAVVFIIASLYHGFLGVREIVEDYIHCHIIKKFIILSLLALVAVSIVVGICGCVVLQVFYPY